MMSIGARLREERLRRRLRIDQVAELTKISAAMLEAIETENFDRLPGGFFTRSFIRQYARVLALPDDEVEAELTRLSVPEASAAAVPQPAFRPEVEPATVAGAFSGRFRGHQPLGSAIAFLLIVAACSVIYVLWQRTQGRAEDDLRPPARVVQATPEPPRPAPKEEPAPAVPAPAVQPPAPAPSEVRVELRAVARAWVRITADGKTVWQGTLAENETRSYQAHSALSLLTGNAGGLEVTWNGKPTGPIGRAGQVRTVEFTPETFRVLEPAPPARRPPGAP